MKGQGKRRFPGRPQKESGSPNMAEQPGIQKSGCRCFGSTIRSPWIQQGLPHSAEGSSPQGKSLGRGFDPDSEVKRAIPLKPEEPDVMESRDSWGDVERASSYSSSIRCSAIPRTRCHWMIFSSGWTPSLTRIFWTLGPTIASLLKM